MISLRTKAIAILSVLSLTLMAALFVLALTAGPEQYRNLLLVTPSIYSATGFSPKKIEQFCKDKFLITYEIPQAKTAEAVHSNHQITTIGTNSCYWNLMSYSLLNGSFFTKTAWDDKQNHAVLNETAAYDIFGSINISGRTLKINGETWLVVGVIQDEDNESSKVYIPSSVTGGQTNSLLALIDVDAGINEAYAKNTLKGLGVNETSYYIMNLSDAALIYLERFSAAWKTALCILILIFMRYKMIILKNKYLCYKDRLRQKYLKELFMENRMDFLKTTGSIILLMTGAAVIGSILPQILSTCLKWQDLPPASILFGERNFIAKTAFLQDNDLLGTALFFILLIVLALIFFLAWKRLPRDMEGSKEAHIEVKSNG